MQAENTAKKEKLAAFAHRLGVLAGRARLKQVDIARSLGVGSQRVGQWFQGRNFPGGDIELALADLLGVSRSWLIEGIETTDIPGVLREDASPYGTAPIVKIRREIRESIEALLDIAGDDVARLGWIVEQLRGHLRAPGHWESSTIHAEVIEQVLAEELKERAAQPKADQGLSGVGGAGGR